MDTVHKIVTDYMIFKKTDNKTKHLILYAKSNNKPTGIGGDDKCGLFTCLYLLNVLPAIKVVFFTKEETGCAGAGDIDLNFFNNCRYVLEVDRRGKTDFIDKYGGNKTLNQNFSSEIGHLKAKYGFKSATGIFTDVMKLFSRYVGISVVNISGGY